MQKRINMKDRKIANKGDYIVICKHEDKSLIGRVIQVINISPRIAKFSGGFVEHDAYYIADECDEWRPFIKHYYGKTN